MKGYGLATWLKKEEYKNYFVSASCVGGQEASSIRLNTLNTQERNQIDVVARARTTNLCKSLSVGNYSGNMGLAAGGMDDGSIMIWDIDTLYKEGDTFNDNVQSPSLISNQLVHEGSVNAIEFNPNIPNLIASGGAEVFIQDIQHSLEEPNVFTPGEPNYHEGETITAISWNKVVPYILASAGNTGQIVVWDLKNTKAIFNLKDPNLVSYNYDMFSEGKTEQITANYQIIWSLKVPTQFLISNDNETMTMWDLRKADTPLLSLSDIHSGGILSCSWCPQDQNIIASSSNEGKTCFVHSDTGDLISEIRNGKKYQNIEWSPYNRGLILGYSTEDETDIFNFSSATTPKEESTDSSYAPKWLSRPIGARFGFGGKLVTFSQSSEEPIKLYQTQTAPEVNTRLLELEETKTQDDAVSIIDTYIENNGKSEIEKMEWITLRSLANQNYDSLFSLLEIDKDAVYNEAERFSGKKKNKRAHKPDSNRKISKGGLEDLDATQANSFFESLSKTSDQRKEEEEKKTDAKPGTKMTQETISRNSNWNEGAEGIIKRNLMVGNLEGAAECALKCGRATEALLIALSSDNEEIFEQIKEEYFSSSKDEFIKTVIKGISNNEVEGLIANLSQSNWKEALAYTLSYSEERKIHEYVEEIAEVVLKKRDVNSAIICYMVSKNIDQLSDLWKVRADSIIKKNPQYKYTVYSNYAEKITLFRQITGIQKATKDCDEVIAELADILVNEGLPDIALKYLTQNYCKSEECEKIRERIYYSKHSQLASQFEGPRYRHNVHELPKIKPNIQQRDRRGPINNRGRGGFRKDARPFDTHNPAGPTTFNPSQTQFEKGPQPPKKNTRGPGFIQTEKGSSNFGYSKTDPILASSEDSKVAASPKQNPTRKPKVQPMPTANTHIFDPSKAPDHPPPPVPTGRHNPHPTPVENPRVGGPPPPKAGVTPPAPIGLQTPSQSLGAFPPAFGGPPTREQEPVIAATKVKPPTASMKPKAARPIQRYAPPPRLEGSEPASQPPISSAPQENNPPPFGAGAPPPVRGAPPARGRGAPPMRGAPPTRGAPPMRGAPPARGGPPMGRGGMQAPPPSQSQSDGGRPSMRGGMGGAPPPPKIGRRGQ
ncbi:unnamed protein product [Moneuplotes crassus]|uniref:Sec16 Sec23-binding domain-containing protein n=2 Tax=Euplotes crassus TaxID=5936 RepID=A0AAD1XLS3_EUPCR|nr:unnamed protein product [Moneuplotes crassus]